VSVVDDLDTGDAHAAALYGVASDGAAVA
jgi:hypothetical protein